MPDHPFVHFGGEHFTAMAIAIGGSIALAWAARAATARQTPRGIALDRALRWILAVACLLTEGSELIGARLAGVPLRHTLPLHLCDISILLAPVVLLTGSRYVFELLYFWGIGGAVQAIVTPTVWWGFPGLPCIAFFLGHGLIIASALYATAAMRLRPRPRSILRVWLLTLLYGFAIIPVNLALGDTNYLFVMGKPSTPSLLDVLGPWPWYLLSLVAIALLVNVLCYAPFFLRDRWARGRTRGVG